MILWLAGIVGAFLTALYSFRMIFITFYGEVKTEPSFIAGKLMTVPLVILATLSVLGGFIELPSSMGNIHLFSGLVNNTLPVVAIRNVEHLEWVFQLVSSLIALSGIYLAYLFYYKKPGFIETFNHSRINHFFEKGFEFDNLYNFLFVKPVVWFSEIDKNDIFDKLNISVANMALLGNRILSVAQNGKLRWYLLSFAIGIAVILTLMTIK
jgi:NADH-quinone oxidoreductase subunit L